MGIHYHGVWSHCCATKHNLYLDVIIYHDNARSFFNTVPPEVEVTATLMRVVVGNSTTLICTVPRSNPMGSYSYRWVHNNSITLSETSSRLTVSILTESDVGVYRCEVTNSAGLSGSNGTTIELGSEFLF